MDENTAQPTANPQPSTPTLRLVFFGGGAYGSQPPPAQKYTSLLAARTWRSSLVNASDGLALSSRKIHRDRAREEMTLPHSRSA